MKHVGAVIEAKLETNVESSKPWGYISPRRFDNQAHVVTSSPYVKPVRAIRQGPTATIKDQRRPRT